MKPFLSMILSLSLLAPAGLATEGQAEPVRNKATAKEQPAPQRLSLEERADLSEREQKPGPEVAGGALSAQHLTYAVIALAAAVIVLIAK